MEYIYFARPDSDIDADQHAFGPQADGAAGWRMESFVDADIVTGVPDSSISAAIGFAEQTGIPYELGSDQEQDTPDGRSSSRARNCASRA